MSARLVVVMVRNTTCSATRVCPGVQRIPVDMTSKSLPANAGRTATLLAGTCQNLREQILGAPTRINLRLGEEKSCSPNRHALHECMYCQDAAFSIAAQVPSPVPGRGALLFPVSPPLLPFFLKKSSS